MIAPFQEVAAQQQYPVQIQPTVSFPSVFINDYADPSTTNIRVYLADLTKGNYRINIRLKIIGTGGSSKDVYYESKTGITLTMNGGEVYFLNDQELATLFSTTNLTTNASVGGGFANTLNEGIYSLVLEAFDATLTDVAVSNARTDFTIFNVVRYDPPLLNSPINGEKFDIQTINQNIFFNWTPRHIVFSPKQQVKYRFRMIKVVPVDRNPYDAMNTSISTGMGNIDVSDLDFPTFIYSPTDLPLEQGAVYAWQVEAYEVINGVTKSSSRFKNEGKSEVFTFSIKENCDPVTIYPVSKTGNEITLSWSGANAISDYSEFEVNYRQEGTSMPWTPVLTSVPTITLNNTVLQTDITYEYTVKPKCKNWQTPVYGGTFKLNPATCVAPAPIQVLFSPNGSPVLSWTENASVGTIRVSYKLKNSSGQFTTVDVAGGTQTYTLPEITSQDGYTIKVDAVCGTETAEGQTNSFNYGENGIVGPCPVPMPFLLSTERLKSDTAKLNWTNIPAAHTGYSITYWHKDSTANTHSINNLTAPTTPANLLFDNQLYNYRITFMCGTKSTTTDVGMFRIDGSAGTIPIDPATADCFPPVDLQGQARSTTSAFVEWNKISGADEYQLFYGVKGTKPFTSFKTTGTSTTLKGLVDSEKYQFIVRVRCSGLYSIFSDTALVDLAQNIANKNCDTVAFVAATKKTTTNILLAWEFDTNYSGYIVKYRESAQPPASVYTQEFTDMDTLRSNNLYKDSVKFTFQNLKAGTEYVFTVQAVCGAGKSYISAPLKVSTLPDANSTGECGSANACDKTDKTPLTSLNVKEKFNCADYEVTVDVIENSTSSTGKYTGSGHMAMPIAGVGDFVTMRLSFKDITINKDPRCVIDGTINIDSVNAGLLPTEVREQIGGYMDQLTDAIDQANSLLAQAADGLKQAQGGVQDATDYFQGGEGVGSVVTGDLGEKTVSGSVPTTTTSATVSGFNITMPNSDAITVAAFPAMVKDKDGNVFQVTSTGAVTHVGKYDETFVVDPIVVDPSDIKVVFTENASATFDFDAWDPKYAGVLQIEREYEKIKTDYYVPAKFITPGVLDVVDATLSGSSAAPGKVQFANGKGLVYKHTTSGTTFTVKLAGGPGSDAQEIYAWYVDGANKTAIGKLLLPSYTPQTKKVVIIPVDLVNNKRQVIPASVYQTYLNKTYGKIGITYQVLVDDSFRGNKTWDADNNKSVQASGSGLLSNDYVGEEAAMIQAYVASKGADAIETGTAYLLAPYEVSRLENSLLGKMPAQEQFGFIYTGSSTDEGVSRTIAHELGHGAYHLEHIFNSIYLGPGVNNVNQNSSLNLMSYFNSPDANQLWKFQWDVVQAPGHVWGIFQKNKNTQAKKTPKEKFCDALGKMPSNPSPGDWAELDEGLEDITPIPFVSPTPVGGSEIYTNEIYNYSKRILYTMYCRSNILISFYYFNRGVTAAADDYNSKAETDKPDIAFYFGTIDGEVFVKGNSTLQNYLNEKVDLIYGTTIKSSPIATDQKLKCAIQTLLYELGEHYNIRDGIIVEAECKKQSSSTPETPVVAVPVVTTPKAPFKILSVQTVVDRNDNVRIKWKLPANTRAYTTLIITTINNNSTTNSDITSNTTTGINNTTINFSIDGEGYFYYDYVESNRVAEKQFSYKLTVKELDEDEFPTGQIDEISAKAGKFQGWYFNECIYGKVTLGLAVTDDNTAKFKWTDDNGSNIPELNNLSNQAIITAYVITKNQNFKVQRTHTDSRIIDFAFTKVSIKACGSTFHLTDITPPTNSRPSDRRSVSDGGTLMVVRNDESQNNGFSIVNQSPNGAQGDIVYDAGMRAFEGTITWTIAGMAIPNSLGKKITQIETYSKIANDYVIHVEAPGEDHTAILKIFNEDIKPVAPDKVVYNDVFRNMGLICDEISAIQQMLKNCKIEVPFVCEGPTPSIFSYNAEKVNSNLVVREQSGLVTMSIVSDEGYSKTFPGIPAVGTQLTVGISGGGGINFNYDTYLRDARMKALEPPYSINGGNLLFPIKLKIATIGQTWAILGVSAETSFPLKISFFSEPPSCRVKIRAALDPIKLTLNAQAFGADFTLYPYTLYSPPAGSYLMQKCLVK